jgi:hypothetical protein
MYKTLKPQPCSLSKVSILVFIFLTCSAILSPLHFSELTPTRSHSTFPPYYSGRLQIVEMISNSKSFVIQAFIALTIIASSLTFSVSAAAIGPTRQFLFFSLVVREALF